MIAVNGREVPDYPGIARWYCEGVVEERIDACRFVKQACRRYLRMLEAAKAGRAKYYFSIEWCVTACDFLEKLPLSKGGRAGQLLVLEPWQIWLTCAIFGFRRDDRSYPAARGHRLVREVYLEVPRGSGKSEWVAGIGLFCFTCEGEEGSQIYIGAPKEDQGLKVFTPMKTFIRKEPDLIEQFGLRVIESKISKPADPSAEIIIVSSIGDREDGHDPHVCIMEEVHAQEEGLWQVMNSAQGKRPSNLFLQITTAGRRASGICWQVRTRLINVLENRLHDDSFFGVIYTVDAEEAKDEKLLFSVKALRKANPMFGVTLDPSTIEGMIRKAKGSSGPAGLQELKRTRFNIWTNSAGRLISAENWAACRRKHMAIEDFRGQRCWIGGDLASKNDITAAGIMFETGDVISIFNRYFVPAQSVSFLRDDIGDMYRAWVEQGWLTVTPGGITDYGFIEEVLRGWSRMFEPEAIVFDSYQSNQILASLYNDNLPAMSMSSGMKSVSEPAKDFLAHVDAGLLEHDGNPVTEWMAMNVVGYLDKRGNVLPQKEEPNSPLKIDGITALINANAARIDAELKVETKKESVFLKRAREGQPILREVD